MEIKSFTFNPFATNSYVLSSAGEAVLIDAASHVPAEHVAVERYVGERNLDVKHLLLTHGHIDHLFGCAHFAGRFGMEWQMHGADRPFVERAPEQARAFGVRLGAPPPVGEVLAEGHVVRFGEAALHVLHVPGHSPGSVAFVSEADEAAVSGDVLFQNSIGRTEGLPQTSLPQLMQSIRRKLLPLGDTCAVYPGHGPATTVGRERKSNPFLTGRVANGE